MDGGKAMWEVETIRGAFFSRTEPDDWEVLASRVSGDARRLARVYQVPGRHLRVCRYVRTPGEPHLVGEWWNPDAEASSVVETLVDAEPLIEAFLNTPSTGIVDRATVRGRSPRRRNGPRRPPAG
jgi:hypothetical protein